MAQIGPASCHAHLIAACVAPPDSASRSCATDICSDARRVCSQAELDLALIPARQLSLALDRLGSEHRLGGIAGRPSPGLSA